MIALTPDQHKIVDVAFKRFAKVGHENTTMAQIAKDLGYSRTFLYYYFPDKESIFRGALARRSDLYFESIEKELKKKLSGFKTLEGVLKLKISCARDFQCLGIYTNVEMFRMLITDEDLKYIFVKEHKLVTQIIQMGIKDGSIRKCNAAKTASLIIDGVHGSMSVVLKKLMVDTHISQKHLDAIAKRQLEFGGFLLQAIKKN
jgi:AcrR family transcriptional regulator